MSAPRFVARHTPGPTRIQAIVVLEVNGKDHHIAYFRSSWLAAVVRNALEADPTAINVIVPVIPAEAQTDV